MSEPELTFRTLGGKLRLAELPVAEPAADLWRRIAERHGANLRRARRRRLLLAVSGGAAVVLACLGLAWWLARAQPANEIDWQARAQALEIRLHALDATASPRASGRAAEDELARIDASLQAAYDRGADRQQLSALWKRRSELLGALLHARLQNAEISRI